MPAMDILADIFTSYVRDKEAHLSVDSFSVHI
jgi:hypothetical protein